MAVTSLTRSSCGAEASSLPKAASSAPRSCWSERGRRTRTRSPTPCASRSGNRENGPGEPGHRQQRPRGYRINGKSAWFECASSHPSATRLPDGRGCRTAAAVSAVAWRASRCGLCSPEPLDLAQFRFDRGHGDGVPAGIACCRAVVRPHALPGPHRRRHTHRSERIAVALSPAAGPAD